MNSPDNIRFAILGCGAATELLYLPALSRRRDARGTLLIDINAERRKQLASMFNVEYSYHDVDEYYGLFDAAVIALPNALHGTAIKMLSQHKAVLVERPMALWVSECDDMIRAAEQTGAPLAISLKRRFIWSHRLAYLLIQGGALGRIESFDFREGYIYEARYF